MSVLRRKYPFKSGGKWVVDCLIYSLIVVLILFFLEPFGFNGFGGNKFLASLAFGLVTFCCCTVYHLLIFKPLERKVHPWRIWHHVLAVLGMILLIGLCNFMAFALIIHIPFRMQYFLLFLYWTFIIGIIITILATGLGYYRYLRNQLDALLEKTTKKLEGIKVTIHDTRVRGDDICIHINDLLFIEAQKNNVAVCYLNEGKFVRAEIQTTLSAVLEDMADYANVFQCHRSFIVNLNNISSAKGNSNGYTLELAGGVAKVPVSRSFVPKLRSFIA